MVFIRSQLLVAAVLASHFCVGALAAPPPWLYRRTNSTSQCRQTKVAVLGAGVAGITAAQALSNASVTDFLIVEYNSEIGGRCTHAPFGMDADGNNYTVELGANWVQGTVSPGGPENPIWTLANKYNVTNFFTNLSSLLTYDSTGYIDYTSILDDFEAAYGFAEYNAGEILSENLQDRSFRSAFNIGGFKPKGDPHAMAIEWYEMDYEYAQIPDVSSQLFTVANFNSTYYGFSELNQFVFDQDGFNKFIHGQASEYLAANDSRLLLNTIVTNISYTDDGVTVYNEDGSCIEAEYAIVTFSVGVLQSDDITFEPELPDWKQIAINTMQMGTYTKIFLQFKPDEVFWDTNTTYFMYASPNRGYYPIWQSLESPDFLPGSGIFFVTVTTDQSYIVDQQDDETTKQQVLVALREMFGNDTVPEPIAFMYPRWSITPWAYGSYSNWPPGLTLEGHQNLRANVSHVYFAGEALSPEFYGYLQGAYFEGKSTGAAVAACVLGDCSGKSFYETLHGTTPAEYYNITNGWSQTSFQTIGDLDTEGGGG